MQVGAFIARLSRAPLNYTLEIRIVALLDIATKFIGILG